MAALMAKRLLTVEALTRIVCAAAHAAIEAPRRAHQAKQRAKKSHRRQKKALMIRYATQAALDRQWAESLEFLKE